MIIIHLIGDNEVKEEVNSLSEPRGLPHGLRERGGGGEKRRGGGGSVKTLFDMFPKLYKAELCNRVSMYTHLACLMCVV